MNNKKFKIGLIASFISISLIALLWFRFGEKILALTDQEILNPQLTADFSVTPSEVVFPNSVSFKTKIDGIKVGDTIDFTYWLNCPYDSTDFSYLSGKEICGDPTKDPKLGQRLIGIKGVINIPSQNYAQAGKSTAKILIEKNGQKIERRSTVTVKPKIDLKANGVYHTLANIPSGSDLVLSWNVQGMSNAGKCSSSWSGEKPASGTETLRGPNISNKDYSMTCTEPDGTSNTDTVKVTSVPKVTIRLQDNVNQSQNASEATAAFDSDTAIIWEAIGTDGSATPCVGKGNDPLWDGKLLPANGSFQITGLSSSTNYAVECHNDGGKSEATIAVKVNKGNCAFQGNNEINAVFFCKNKLAVLNNSDNINFTGSYVASDFSISAVSKNIRFYYQPNLDQNWPPGFKYLSLPSAQETKNK